ncbi:leucine-rich repeat-containing G-protein coupled receptor 5-like isoform X2 [Diabrotica virgifera virgifera]|nr:leucine-rich repeat-containing G-protein coupled receptor 5-like isoform X2 [Diabrotica virgifera virgifera]
MPKEAVLFCLALLSCVASQSPTTQNFVTQLAESVTSAMNETKECFEDKSAKIRTFSSLNEYQGNRASFDPRQPTYQGNIVNFSCNTIESLPKNSFISFGSNSIMKIDLHDKEISEIEPGAFSELFCLQELNLSHNNLTNLSEGSFEGLNSLVQLDLSFNSLQEIPDNGLTFIELKTLRVLDLSHNEIKSLNQLSFMTLDALEILRIGHNKIKTIDPRVFNYLGALKQLYLNDNSLVETSAEQWKGLTNLTDLDLSNNYLSSFDMTSNYSFAHIRNLNLSGNTLQYMNIFGIKQTFPNLLTLDLSNNNWFCQDLEVLKHGLHDSKIILPTPVDCTTESSTASTSVKTPKVEPVPNTQNNEIEKKYEQILDQHKMLMDSNEQISAAVQDLRGIVIFLFIVIILCVVVEAGMRLGICRSWYYSLMGRTSRGYFDANDSESVGLIPR